jgi:ribose-phosphate pyrophosphokinase
MSTLVLALPGMEHLAAQLARTLGTAASVVHLHRFPDGECRVLIGPSVRHKIVVLVAGLDHPDDKLLPLLFAAATARELRAQSLGLVAPFLPYLRQDQRFHPGEGVSARYFTGILDRTVDWLVTVDPHLHRITSLDQLFTVPVEVIHAAPVVAAWIRSNVPRPMLIGPDGESMQWVGALASLLQAPFAVLSKRRSGDRRVELQLPSLDACLGHQPVLVDDIISSGATMLEATRLLRAAGWPIPVCLGVHGIFAGGAYEALQAAGVRCIVTCNTIPHASNAMDVGPLLAPAVARRVQLAFTPPTPMEAVR